MFNTDFDPLAMLQHLQAQDLVHAENMVKVSDFILALSQQVDTQRLQNEALYTMVVNLNKIVMIQQDRIQALESQVNSSINNNSLKD